MFTPQRKARHALSITPKSEAARGGASSIQNVRRSGGSGGKGKSVAFLDGPPPPLGLLAEKSENLQGSRPETSGKEDWISFKEAGLLDQSSMQRKDYEASAEKVGKLQTELYEYQYNMGLLLIEKNEWSSKYDELMKSLVEAEEMLKREQSAHLIAISEVEKREENLRKALSVEKQCVFDLEKALRESCTENEQSKLLYEKKMTDADAVVSNYGDKSLNLNEKLHATEVKLAETSRMRSEVEWRLNEVEARESILRKERTCLNAEREAHNLSLHKNKEDMREWERRLQEGEQNLCDRRIALNESEEKLNQEARNLKLKEKELEEEKHRIALKNAGAKKADFDANRILVNATAKEREIDSMKCRLERKEKELLSLEERLSARERMEIQHLIDEQSETLNKKQQEFELEMEERRISFEKELNSRSVATDAREKDIKHMEEKLTKREEALEKKSKRLKDKEEEIKEKTVVLKNLDKSIKSEQKLLQAEKEQLLSEKSDLISVKDECERIRAEITQQEHQIHAEQEKLRITNSERSEFDRLQSELNREIAEYRLERETLHKDAEDLRLQKERFEAEWESLDEKRFALDNKLKKIAQENENLEKLRKSEQERLAEEKLEMQNRIEKQFEALKRDKESFEATMKHEQSSLYEKAENEHLQMVHDFDLRRRNLEIDLQCRQEEAERNLRERERVFEEEKERELRNIRCLKEQSQKEADDAKLEMRSLEKARQEVEFSKKQLESFQLEMQKDINDLGDLSGKLKEQREKFIREKTHFLSFLEKLKWCKNCSELSREFIISDPKLSEAEGLDITPSSLRLLDVFLTAEIDSGNEGPKGRVSWLQKCASKIFKSSPSKKAGQLADEPSEEGTFQNLQEDDDAIGQPAEEGTFQNLPEEEANLMLSKQLSESDAAPKEVDESSYNTSKPGEQTADSQHSDVRSVSRRKPRGGMHRTHSVQAVVEDAKAIIGEAGDEPPLPNKSTHSSADYGVSTRSGRTLGNRERKRPHGHGGNELKAQPGQKKRAQTAAAPVAQISSGKRYNLRRHRNVGEIEAVKQEGEENTILRVSHEADSVPSLPNNDERVETSKDEAASVEKYEMTEEVVEEVAGVGTRSADYAVTEEISEVPEDDEDNDGSTFTEDEVGDDADDLEHSGEASIGKKLWKFFTTS